MLRMFRPTKRIDRLTKTFCRYLLYTVSVTVLPWIICAVLHLSDIDVDLAFCEFYEPSMSAIFHDIHVMYV